MSDERPRRRRPTRDRLFLAIWTLLAVALLIVPINFWVFFVLRAEHHWRSFTLWGVKYEWDSLTNGTFVALAYAQLAAGVGALACGLGILVRGSSSVGERFASVLLGLLGAIVGLGGPLAMWSTKHLNTPIG